MKSIWRCVVYQGVLLSGVCLLAGCYTPEISSSMSSPKLIYQDPAFDLAALQSGNLAVGAVTRPDTADYYAAVPIADRVYEQVRYFWPGVKVLSMPDVINIMGKDLHKQMQEEFRQDAVLLPDQVAALKPLKKEARYLMLVDIREDRENSFAASSSEDITRREKDPQTGEYKDVVEGTTYTSLRGSNRFMRVLFIIYDLDRCQHVWIATASGSTSFNNTRESTSGYPAVPDAAQASPGEIVSALLGRVMKKLPSVVAVKDSIGRKAATRRGTMKPLVVISEDPDQAPR